MALLAVRPRQHTGFLGFHLPQAHKKSTLKVLWEKEYELLDQTCMHTFRNHSNVNQYLQRYWQLASNSSEPINRKKLGKIFSLEKIENPQVVAAFIKQQKRPMICVNDHEDIVDFERTKKTINAAFQEILPDK
jgi:hypothetical protein